MSRLDVVLEAAIAELEKIETKFKKAPKRKYSPEFIKSTNENITLLWETSNAQVDSMTVCCLCGVQVIESQSLGDSHKKCANPQTPNRNWGESAI